MWVASACLAGLTGNVLWFNNPLHLAVLNFLANAAEAVIAALLVGWAVVRPGARLPVRRRVRNPSLPMSVPIAQLLGRQFR